MMMMMKMMNASFILQKSRSAEYKKKNSWYKPMCNNKIFQDKNDRTTQIIPSFDFYRNDCFAL